MIFPAGTLLNADQDGDGVPDIIYTRVSYTYQIPNQVGDDTTASSNRVTVWLSRLLAQTDQFDTKVKFLHNKYHNDGFVFHYFVTKSNIWLQFQLNLFYCK
jgi:hypothetical protein